MATKKISKGRGRPAKPAKSAKLSKPQIDDAGTGKLSLEKLERHLWGAADILRGSIDSGDYKHYIFGLLFYKRLSDVWEEEYEQLLEELGDEEEALDPKEHRFQIPKGHFWNDVRKKSHNIGEALTLAFNAIEDTNEALRQIFQDIDFNNKERFPDAVLEKLLHHFERHRLRKVDVEPDVLGQAYEYLIAQFADDAGKKGGEFYTPRQVVKLMVECLRPEEGLSIYDPACGSGGMLLEAVHFMQRNDLDPRSLSLFGQEKNLNTWAICRMNMFLHDIADAKIERGDTLLDPKHIEGGAKKRLKTFDMVLANPPFSLSPWGHEVWSKSDPWGRDGFGCPPANYGDLAFVEHMICSLSETGRMAVVVPHGVLFRGGAEGTIRQRILEEDLLEGIIGLAPNLFYGTGIPAAVLLLNNRKPATRKNRVILVNGENEFVEGQSQNLLSAENVRRLTRAFAAFTDVARFARVVGVRELASNDFNLNLSRYVQTGAAEDAIDVAAHVNELRELTAVRDEAERMLNKFLKRLGYVP